MLIRNRHSFSNAPFILHLSSRNGFTMIEIIVVVIIVAIMFAVMLPSMRSTAEGNRLRSSVRQVMTLMKYARTEAVFNARTTQVFLDTQNHQFWLDLRTPDEKTGRYDPKKLKTNMERKRELDTRVRFEAIDADEDNILKGDVVAFDFYPDGTASRGHISFTNGSPTLYTLEVLKSTGMVELKKGDMETVKAESGTTAYPLPPNYDDAYSAAEAER